MADFLTRLAERTLGAAPVVQPLIAPRFTPEPTANPPDSGWNDEVRSSGDLRDAAPPADAPTGRSERTVVEHPGDLASVAPDGPDPRKGEAGVASPSSARASSPSRPRSAEHVPDRTTPRPAEREGGVAPPIGSPAGAYEPEARESVGPVGETWPDRGAPDEFRSTETAASTPGARAGASPQIRSFMDASSTEQDAPEPGARVEPAEKMLVTRDTADGRSEEAAKAFPGSREDPSPVTPSRGARATEITANPARRPGRSDEATARPAAPSDFPDLSSRAPGRAAGPERRSGLLPGSNPDERESGPQPEASPPTSAAPNPMLVKPTMGPSDAHPEGDPRRPPPPEPPPPIIRVNIGRVEVRAVTPPPQRQQAATPARLSLDDYLRSRSGGRR